MHMLNFKRRGCDSGEGRWTLQAAINEGIPAAVIRSGRFTRLAPRDSGRPADELMPAMRPEFSGRTETLTAKTGGAK